MAETALQDSGFLHESGPKTQTNPENTLINFEEKAQVLRVNKKMDLLLKVACNPDISPYTVDTCSNELNTTLNYVIRDLPHLITGIEIIEDNQRMRRTIEEPEGVNYRDTIFLSRSSRSFRSENYCLPLPYSKKSPAFEPEPTEITQTVSFGRMNLGVQSQVPVVYLSLSSNSDNKVFDVFDLKNIKTIKLSDKEVFTPYNFNPLTPRPDAITYYLEYLGFVVPHQNMDISILNAGSSNNDHFVAYLPIEEMFHVTKSKIGARRLLSGFIVEVSKTGIFMYEINKQKFPDLGNNEASLRSLIEQCKGDDTVKRKGQIEIYSGVEVIKRLNAVRKS